MQDARRSRAALEAELETLRLRVEELERERRPAEIIIHGDPAQREDPLVSQVPAVLWAADLELRLTWWTGGGIRSLGVKPEDMLGVDIYTFLRTQDPEDPAIVAHRNALDGFSASYEQELDGVVFSVHVGPQYDASGDICGAVGVGLDITARVRAEHELREALHRLRTLSGLIPICMHCKNVRGDDGYWELVENYVRDHSNAEFTHAICPDCMKRELDEGRDGA